MNLIVRRVIEASESLSKWWTFPVSLLARHKAMKNAPEIVPARLPHEMVPWAGFGDWVTGTISTSWLLIGFVLRNGALGLRSFLDFTFAHCRDQDIA